MKTYDVIVVGSGSGGEIVDAAVSHGMTVAWVDKGPLGGTCLNVGCIPSKILVTTADRIIEIEEAKKLGIRVDINTIDFPEVMQRARQPIEQSHQAMEKGIASAKNLDYYKGQGHFTKDYTIEVLGKEIYGKKIFLVSGARPLIPPIKGLESIPYFTNENVFDLQKKPTSMIIIGGGYIAVEFAHFFSAMGTDVTIVQRGNRLIPGAEPEISALLKEKLQKRMKIIMNTEVLEVKKHQEGITVIGKESKTGDEVTTTAETIFIAAGRTSNADLLQVEKTNVKTDAKGYILVNEYLETSMKNIWAFGDATGKAMFKHVANEEAIIAWKNAFHKQKTKMQYHATPYAVFTSPQIAAVGLTQQQAQKNYEVLIGRARYVDVAKGGAMMEHDGFAKAIVEKKTGIILGFHIIGPYASMLIQEVINAMALGGNISLIAQGMHIHPALTELILRTLGNLQEE